MQPSWDIFEGKFLLCCTKYKARHDEVVKELSRVGICDYITQWDVTDTPIKRILHRSITTGKLLSKIGHFSCCLSHYKAIKTAYELGCKSVLILEDDIRFRKDLSNIEEAIGLLPKDFDYAQFEIRKPQKMPTPEFVSMHTRNVVNKRWMRYQDLRGGGCYALSRRGMEKMIQAIESDIVDSSVALKINDSYVARLSGINKYFCFPPIAVQAISGEHNSPMMGYWEFLRQMGVGFSDYETEGTCNPFAD